MLTTILYALFIGWIHNTFFYEYETFWSSLIAIVMHEQLQPGYTHAEDELLYDGSYPKWSEYTPDWQREEMYHRWNDADYYDVVYTMFMPTVFDYYHWGWSFWDYWPFWDWWFSVSKVH